MENRDRVAYSLLVGVIFLAILGTGDQAQAFSSIRSNFFSAYPEAVGSRLDDLPSRADHCGVCHYRFSGGGARNLYGLAVQALPVRSAAEILSIGSVDSDGDQFTNAQEILAGVGFPNTPTFPGLTPDNVGEVSNIDLVDIESHLVPSTDTATESSTWGAVKRLYH